MAEKSNSRRPVRNWSLRHKILLPFFLILLLLVTVSTGSFVLLITRALQKTANERLFACQDVIFREIKKQEILLETYTDLIGYAYLISGNDTTSESLVIQQQHLV